MMRDLKLKDTTDATAGDLMTGEDGDLVLVEGVEQVMQRVRTRLRMIQGEWFLDTEAGLPWFTEVLGKNLDFDRTEAMLRHEILSTPGVLEITRFSMDYDRAKRELHLRFLFTTEDGVAEFEGGIP
jgi:hypothetical protein